MKKIFISHREKDADQVAGFVELLHVIGIPRTTVQDEVILTKIVRIWLRYAKQKGK